MFVDIDRDDAATRKGQDLHDEQADQNACADYSYGVAGRGNGATHGMGGHGHRFGHRGVLKRKRIRQSVDDVRRDGYVFGKGTFLPVVPAGDSKHVPVVAEIHTTLGAIVADAAEHGRIEGDAVARAPLAYLRAR